jgi:inorganic pyrophosphatase
MKSVNVLIEIPKGEKRRLHINWARTHWIDGGPIKRVISVNKGIMLVAYGFVIGTKVKDGKHFDELDAIVYSKKSFKIGQRVKCSPIAYFHLKNGDHKIIGTDRSTTVEKWRDISPKLRRLLVEYFGYKSPVIRVGGRHDAEVLIKKHQTKKPLRIPSKVIIKKEAMK